MESIKDKVAIVGMGCTKFGERWDAGMEDLMVEAAYEAFEDAGIGPKDVQAAWIGTVFSGITALTLSPLRLAVHPHDQGGEHVRHGLGGLAGRLLRGRRRYLRHRPRHRRGEAQGLGLRPG